jgi:hypothetical protein
VIDGIRSETSETIQTINSSETETEIDKDKDRSKSDYQTSHSHTKAAKACKRAFAILPDGLALLSVKSNSSSESESVCCVAIDCKRAERRTVGIGNGCVDTGYSKVGISC